MFYYLYQITNLVNAKIYVGVHKTQDMNDGYMGSGKVILRAIKKHGINNFEKVILEQFVDAKSMYAREKEVVTEDFLSRKDVYNLRRGGFGGFDWINKKGLNYNPIAQRIGGLKTGWKNLQRNNSSPEKNKRRVANRMKKFADDYNASNRGSCRSAETKTKMTASATGSKNSQFGTMWITDGVQNKKCNRSSTIPTGWKPGRSTVTNVPIDYVG